MLSTVLGISQLKKPIKFLLKTQLYVLGLFFDLAEMYDVTNHEMLLTKLQYYGKRETVKAWIESYLSLSFAIC